jgi:Fe-S-cluster-containing dehydrogenase component/DMSO reductase anchor subunit
MPASPDPVRTLIDELIESQRRLDTPVARFAAAHAAADSERHAPGSLSALGAQLIPLSAPGPGEQYAFQVDLDSCTGCKACVSGCHSLNGLDDEETWRDVGLVYGRDSLVTLAGTAGLQHGTSGSHAPERNAELQLGSTSCAAPFAQTVTTACHHCEDPACLNGCPVVAYEKDPLTGIVVHLDDQCIGCSYCVLKCPYDVPKFNERLGIVRKCDMCHGRLAAGEAPACAQACPTQAISIVTVAVTASPIANPKSQNADSKSQSAEHKFDSPNPALTAFSGTDSAYTRPTTRYVSKKPLPADLFAADCQTLRPQHPHYVLVILLVLTQLGVGLLISSQLAAQSSQLQAPSSQLYASLGLVLYATGLVASIAHLGQPLRAWRIFLGLRTSWLSREAVLLGAAFPLLATALFATEFGANLLATFIAPPLPPVLQLALRFAPAAGLVIAGLGVFCSAMIYTDTRRQFWRLSQTLGRMGGTVAITTLVPLSAPLASVLFVAKLALELTSLRGTSTSARLQRGLLSPLVVARLAVAGLAFAGFFMLNPAAAVILFGVGELLERTLFFRAVDSPKMPGVPTS